jgi:propanediol dehydratase small subunit
VLGPADIAISAGALRAQAERAERAGYRPFAENLRRAAELVDLPDNEVLAIYEALRPLRSSSRELEEIAVRLDEASAPRCAALVREAAEAYAFRGLLKPVEGRRVSPPG